MTKISRMARATTLGLAGICGSLMSFSGVLNAAEFFDGRLNGRIYLMEGYQAIQADDGAFADANTNMSTGFQRLRYNLEVSAKINDYVTAYFDLAEEPNDFGTDDQFEISQDLGYIDVDLAGIIQNTPDHEDTWIFRAGNIVSTVFQYRGFSDGAAVQGNPLIGNSVIDLVTAESGIQTLWSTPISHSFIKRVNADIAISIPTFFEDFNDERGYNIYSRASFNTHNGLDLGIGFFVSDLGDQVGIRPFTEVQTAGLIQGDGDNYNFQASGAGSRDTHAGLLPGLDATIFQINAQYRLSPNTLFRGWAGMAKDDYSFVDAQGNQTVASQSVDYAQIESKMRFFAVEASHYLVPESFYVASRYSQVTNDTDGVSGDKDMSRFQFGIGWWLVKNTLFKAEYVSQSEGEFSPGQIGSDWDGFTAELSVVFN